MQYLKNVYIKKQIQLQLSNKRIFKQNSSGKCEEINYRGCPDDSLNNFETKEECEARCQLWSKFPFQTEIS